MPTDYRIVDIMSTHFGYTELLLLGILITLIVIACLLGTMVPKKPPTRKV